MYDIPLIIDTNRSSYTPYPSDFHYIKGNFATISAYHKRNNVKIIMSCHSISFFGMSDYDDDMISCNDDDVKCIMKEFCDNYDIPDFHIINNTIILQDKTPIYQIIETNNYRAKHMSFRRIIIE